MQTPILRGAFVHRRGEDARDEGSIAEYWRAKGFIVKALEDPRERYSRLPDFRLDRDGKPWAYCEVKTVWRHSWVIRILHEERPLEERREVTEKPVDERVTGDLVTAVRQLNAGNPGHTLLNIVMLVNRAPEASASVVARLLSQGRANAGRSLKARRSARLAEELQAFRRDVDLCIWANGFEENKLDVEGYFLLNPDFGDRVRDITGLGFEKQIFLEPAA